MIPLERDPPDFDGGLEMLMLPQPHRVCLRAVKQSGLDLCLLDLDREQHELDGRSRSFYLPDIEI